MVGKKPTVPPSGSTSFRRHARYASTVSTVSILGRASSPTLVPLIPDLKKEKLTIKFDQFAFFVKNELVFLRNRQNPEL